MGSSDNTVGLALAVASSAFVGGSFILKKLGLMRAGKLGVSAGGGGYTYLLEPLWWAGLITMLLGEVANCVAYVFAPAVLVTPLGALSIIVSSVLAHFVLKEHLNKLGVSAGGGGYTYLLEPLWWAGLITMLLGEVANCVAYVFAPAVLVTPLGALSIIVSSVLAHFVLKEHLNKLGVLGCISCIVGSVVVVLHAPEENMPTSVEEIWYLATQPEFLAYALTTFVFVATMVVFFEPRYGQKNILIYLGICSTMGSLTVVSIKAVGVAIKLTLDGTNQLFYPHTWLFVLVTILCGVSQLNYLNKALDTFDLAIVSPVYYVLFTTLTIVANGIMFKDGADQSLSSIASECCGLITILTGTILLHASKEKKAASHAASPWPLDGGISWYISLGSDDLVRNVEDDYFAAPQSSPTPA